MISQNSKWENLKLCVRVGGKCLRAMDAELDENWKPEIIAGGFAGHCTNQGAQKWVYKSNPEYTVIRARLRKNGHFYSQNGRHILSKTPYKFHDYNF